MVMSTRPRVPITQAAARIHREAGSPPPNTHSPSTAPPSKNASPTYSPQRPAVASGEGDGVDGRTVPGEREEARWSHPDTKREGAAGDVAVRLRHGPPRHRVDPVWEWRERHLQLKWLPGNRFGLPLFHILATLVEHVDERQARVGRFGERDHHPCGRGLEQRPARGLRPAQQGVRRGGHAGHDDQQARSEDRDDDATHRLQLRLSAPRPTETGGVERRAPARQPINATTATRSPTAPMTMPTTASVRAVSARSSAWLRALAMAALTRGISRSRRSESSVPVGTFVGNSTSAGSAIKRSSTFWFAIAPPS